jgi:hypothetical protein
VPQKYTLNLDGTTIVCAEKITPSDHKWPHVQIPLSLDQVKAIHIIALDTKYCDLHNANILPGNDGKSYFIDTASNGFAHLISLKNFFFFQNAVFKKETIHFLLKYGSLSDDARAYLEEQKVAQEKTYAKELFQEKAFQLVVAGSVAFFASVLILKGCSKIYGWYKKRSGKHRNNSEKNNIEDLTLNQRHNQPDGADNRQMMPIIS